MLTRRDTFIALFAPVFLTDCSGLNGATTLATAKMYGDDLADALTAAAQEFVINPQSTMDQKALVQQLTVAIQTAKTTLDAAVAQSDATGAVNQIITAANSLYPLVAPYLGSAGLYVPLALDVLRTFVNSLPPPTTSPPPAALQEKAKVYRKSLHRQ